MSANVPLLRFLTFGQQQGVKFDGVKGTEDVLQYATRNKYHLSVEQVQAKANEIKREYIIYGRNAFHREI